MQSRTATAVRDTLESDSVREPEVARSAPAFEPGALIKNRFLIEEIIGRGGMGLVFRALDRHKQEALDPNPRVAIKVLNADFQRHPQALIALERETSKAQTLAHPNVATVFDFDRDGTTVFMTMELLQGQSLDHVIGELRRRGMDRGKALPVIRGIAEGLAYAHRKGIVHSDLKPANVFLLEDGTPKILDFGIARAIPARIGDDRPQDVFDAGAFGAYTEAYATKEMIASADPDPSDDVYALGLIAYELLTGSHPYQRLSATDARDKHLEAAPVKGLKRREWKTLQRCLAFERAARPRDATEFIKLFYLAAPLRKWLIAATVILALLSVFLWYRNYEEAGPMVAFEDLPVETQRSVSAALTEGDREWDFYVKDDNSAALWSALDYYARAYSLHPRNRAAVQGMSKAADALLDSSDDYERKREDAQSLSEMSEYLRSYEPVVDALAR
jgi:serine/threonine protein kinase